MTGENLKLALVALLVCMLVAAAVTDLRSRTISNRLNIGIAALAPLYWAASGLPLWPDIALQVGLAAIVFAVFAGLFALGMMGGGDVKMLAALALWLPWQPLLGMLMLMALIGGAVTLAMLIHHRIRRRKGQLEIPYGVAIALAALWVIGKPIINQFA